MRRSARRNRALWKLSTMSTACGEREICIYKRKDSVGWTYSCFCPLTSAIHISVAPCSESLSQITSSPVPSHVTSLFPTSFEKTLEVPVHRSSTRVSVETARLPGGWVDTVYNALSPAALGTAWVRRVKEGGIEADNDLYHKQRCQIMITAGA